MAGRSPRCPKGWRSPNAPRPRCASACDVADWPTTRSSTTTAPTSNSTISRNTSLPWASRRMRVGSLCHPSCVPAVREVAADRTALLAWHRYASSAIGVRGQIPGFIHLHDMKLSWHDGSGCTRPKTHWSPPGSAHADVRPDARLRDECAGCAGREHRRSGGR